MLLAIYFDEDFINIEGVAITSVLSLQSSSVNGTELDAPETDRFPGDDDSSLSEQILDIAVAEIKAIVEPDCVTDDFRRESVALIGTRGTILAISTC